MGYNPGSTYFEEQELRELNMSSYGPLSDMDPYTISYGDPLIT